MTTFRAWLAATRPKTLVAAVAPIALGGAVVVGASGASGLWADPLFLFTLLSCLGFALCVQVACNFANDLGDSLRGADTAGAQTANWLQSRGVPATAQALPQQ